MNYSENENDRKEVEDDEIEELPESSVDFKAGIVETGFEQPCAKSMDKVNELEQLDLSCNDETRKLVIDLSQNVNKSVILAKKENGNDAMFPYVDNDDSDQISN